MFMQRFVRVGMLFCLRTKYWGVHARHISGRRSFWLHRWSVHTVDRFCPIGRVAYFARTSTDTHPTPTRPPRRSLLASGHAWKTTTATAAPKQIFRASSFEQRRSTAESLARTLQRKKLAARNWRYFVVCCFGGEMFCMGKKNALTCFKADLTEKRHCRGPAWAWTHASIERRCRITRRAYTCVHKVMKWIACTTIPLQIERSARGSRVESRGRRKKKLLRPTKVSYLQFAYMQCIIAL